MTDAARVLPRDGRLRPPLSREAVEALRAVIARKQGYEQAKAQLRAAVIAAHEAGASYWDIQVQAGIPLNTAHRWVRGVKR